MEILAGPYITLGLFKAVLNLGSMDTLQIYEHFTKPRHLHQVSCVCVLVCGWAFFWEGALIKNAKNNLHSQ